MKCDLEESCSLDRKCAVYTGNYWASHTQMLSCEKGTHSLFRLGDVESGLRGVSSCWNEAEFAIKCLWDRPRAPSLIRPSEAAGQVTHVRWDIQLLSELLQLVISKAVCLWLMFLSHRMLHDFLWEDAPHAQSQREAFQAKTFKCAIRLTRFPQRAAVDFFF